ncbi:hypothetical protein [Halobacillus trueperi]|uniref:hypothetical protein n=1 Tax=Halobacillus trueperi TaxID=156205 RepID=UPI0015F29EDC|nr:hypothetical protein [Halobacillus trueperi]
MNHFYRNFSTQDVDPNNQRILPFLPFLLSSPFFHGSGYGGYGSGYGGYGPGYGGYGPGYGGYGSGYGGYGPGYGGFGHGGFRQD